MDSYSKSDHHNLEVHIASECIRLVHAEIEKPNSIGHISLLPTLIEDWTQNSIARPKCFEPDFDITEDSDH